MKQWNILALALGLLCGAMAQAQEPAGSSNPQALSAYEEGKRLYDARDYEGALAKFDEATALEPGKPRWHYNRGLALRKLNRRAESRDALLQARFLEPDYKRAEIDDKLRELGFSPDSGARSSEAGGLGLGEILGIGVVIAAPILVLVIIFLVVRKARRSSPAGTGDRP